MNLKATAIACLAGAACILLIAAAGHVGPGAFALLLLSPFPIYAAAFGWGTKVALFASLAAIIGAGLTVSASAAIITGLMFSIPASMIGNQANLAQTHQDGSVEWYPMQQLFFNLCLILSVGVSLCLVYFGYENTKEQALPLLSDSLDQIMRDNQLFQQLSDEEVLQLKESTFNTLPFWASGFWLIIHAINITLAAFVCRASGLMPRPKDDIPATLSLPMAAVGILVVSLVIAFAADGGLQYYTAPFFGIFLTAFALVGLAVAHYRARSSGTHFMLLMVGYAAILFIYIPLYLFCVSGVMRTLFQPKNPPASPDQNNP